MTARKWKWVLGVSVAVNIFLLAVLGGGAVVLHQNARHYEKAMRGINAWRSAVKELTPAERDQVFGLLRNASLAGEADMEKARAARAQVTVLVSRTPYDPAQATVLSEQARNAENSARCKIENALLLGMKDMSPKERIFISTQILRPSLRLSRLGHPPQKPVAPSPQGTPQGAGQASQ